MSGAQSGAALCSGAPEAFKAYNQFILWQPVPGANGKIDKKPTNPQTMLAHDPHDPAIWMDWATALATAEMTGLGVGFVFTEADPFFFFDIDTDSGEIITI